MQESTWDPSCSLMRHGEQSNNDLNIYLTHTILKHQIYWKALENFVLNFILTQESSYFKFNLELAKKGTLRRL